MAFTYDLQNVKIEEPGFTITFESLEGDVGRWMHRRGEYVLRKVKTTAPVRSGRLKASLRMVHEKTRAPGRKQQIRIGTSGHGRGYAYLVHEGSKPHMIRAKRGGVLSFRVRGKRIRTKVVHHPGQRRRPYLTMHLPSFMGP